MAVHLFRSRVFRQRYRILLHVRSLSLPVIYITAAYIRALFSFRADDKREVLLNAIGKGERAGFRDEADTTTPSASTEKA